MLHTQVYLAFVAGMCEGWCSRIMKMVQDHHGRVLGTPELIKLVVIALAEREEGRSRVEEVTVKNVRVGVFRLRRRCDERHLR